MISAQNLSHRYNLQGTLMQFPNLSCEAGSAVLITGQSGSGKTTLLSIIGGLLTPNTGEVLIDNESIYSKSGKALDKFRGQNIGLVLQQHYFIEAISSLQNLALAQKLGGQKVDLKLARELLAELNILDKQHELPGKLSIGERQRLGIARALINKPKVILADEPTSALDDINCNQVITLLKQEAEMRKTALLVVTHDNRLKQAFSTVINL